MLVLFQLILLVGLTSSLECGVAKPKSRIVGGTPVEYYKYPWYASLHLVGNLEIIICGGSLITPRHVLTAAHCFKYIPEKERAPFYEITLGMFNRCKNDSNAETFRSVEVAVHDQFTESVNLFDIALMKLDRPANFMPVCLPPKGDAIVHENYAIISGFGTTKYGNSNIPCKMNEATVHIFTAKECQEQAQFSDTNLTQLLMEYKTAFCAGLMEGGTDTCQGDSGGPIMTRRDGRFVQEGLVSFGYDCAEPNLPGVYTKISSYIDWLNDHIPEGLPKSVVKRKKEPSKPKRKQSFLKNIIDMAFGIVG